MVKRLHECRGVGREDRDLDRGPALRVRESSEAGEDERPAVPLGVGSVAGGVSGSGVTGGTTSSLLSPSPGAGFGGLIRCSSASLASLACFAFVSADIFDLFPRLSL